MIVEQPLLFLPGLKIAKPLFVSLNAEPLSERIVVRYRVIEPDNGWGGWKYLTPMVRLQQNSVSDQLGQPVPNRILGTLPMDENLLPQKQQLIFEDWVRDLSDQLGLPKPPAKSADKDKDGSSDLSELTFGTDPSDPTDVTPLSVSAEVVGGQTFVEVSFTTQSGSFNTYVEIEESNDGVEWHPVKNTFKQVHTEQNAMTHVDRLTFRSKALLRSLDLQLFRLSVVNR